MQDVSGRIIPGSSCFSPYLKVHELLDWLEKLGNLINIVTWVPGMSLIPKPVKQPVEQA